MRPVGSNVEKSFTISGYKEPGAGYNYLLMIDFAGTCLIKRVKVTNDEIKFALKASGTSVEDFWAGYASQTYKWIHELRND